MVEDRYFTLAKSICNEHLAAHEREDCMTDV